MEIDHVVLAARSRDEAERVLSEAGLGIARGRAIPGLGLSNLVVPLGSSALEIHYPNGEEPAPGAPPLLAIDRDMLATHPSAQLVPVAWLVLVEDEAHLRQLAARHNLPVADVPAEGPGYPPYVLAGFGALYDRPWLPYFIHWPVPPEERPAALAAPHARPPSSIAAIEVAGPADEIERWCGERPRGLRTLPGADRPRSVEVAFADGTSVAFGVG